MPVKEPTPLPGLALANATESAAPALEAPLRENGVEDR